MKEINALQIGGLALEIIRSGKAGRTMGVTSKGLFLNSSDRILFITTAPYQSPFNIQIKQMDTLVEGVQTGDEVSLKDFSIDFPNCGIHIEIGDAEVWQPDGPPRLTTTQNEQAEKIGSIVQKMNYELDSNKGWFFLESPQFLFGSSDPQEERISKVTQNFLDCFRKADLPGCIEFARSIIGLGSGLTPSGDDWLTGFFVVFARIEELRGRKEVFIELLGKTLTEIAFQGTTKISANRIQAACGGWVEQIFLEVVDLIASREKQLGNLDIQSLVKFGHSSGVDTCMGIFAAWKNTFQ
ncbi:MAG: DUF2877 domain-containing protein [Chloroflexi bacterium]|nr:DUF2877 domain-containing protein [Chloroflexota bacterium]